MYQCRSEAISACIFPSDNGILSRGFAPMPGAGTPRARFGSLPVSAGRVTERQSDIMARLGPGIPAKGKIRTLDLESLAFRFLVAVDVAGFSQRSVAEQARAQDDLEIAMTQAAASVGLERERWYRQPRGDGELAVLPQGVNGAVFGG